MSGWSYDESSHRYRDTSTGRYLSAASERGIRDDFLARLSERAASASARVADGSLAAPGWERAMQQVVRQAHGASYALGRGGWAQMSPDDAERLSTAVQGQYAYLRAFAESIQAGDLTAGQIAARTSLYLAAADSSYAYGKAASYEGLALPAMPGVGTLCLVNCGCAWQIEEDDTEWRAFWTLNTSESCATCESRASAYAPYIQPKEAAVPA